MKLCNLCGASIADDAVRCPHCGLPMPAVDDVQPEFACAEAAPAPEPVPADSAPEATKDPADAPIPDEDASGCPDTDDAAQTDAAASPAADTDPPLGTEADRSSAQAAPQGQILFTQPPAAPPPPRYAAPGPRYERVQPQQPDGGLTTAQYFWTLMLFAVPVVGLGFMLYWSFGRTASPARRRLARASLIKVGVGLASALASLIVLTGLLIGMARSRFTEFYSYYRDPYSYFEGFETPQDWYGDSNGGFDRPDSWFRDFFTENEPSRIY